MIVLVESRSRNWRSGKNDPFDSLGDRGAANDRTHEEQKLEIDPMQSSRACCGEHRPQQGELAQINAGGNAGTKWLCTNLEFFSFGVPKRS